MNKSDFSHGTLVDAIMFHSPTSIFEKTLMSPFRQKNRGHPKSIKTSRQQQFSSRQSHSSMPRLSILTAVLTTSLLTSSLPGEVVIDWVLVGDPGNPPQSESNRTSNFRGGDKYGAVDYIYKIGKYEVTNAQYAEFLNTSIRMAWIPTNFIIRICRVTREPRIRHAASNLFPKPRTDKSM